jgi:microcystin degradation protein MlrC
MGDNVGGGAPGDGTILAQALNQRLLTPSFICLHDPESAARARSAGVGARIELSVGGKTDHMHGEPLRSQFRVLSTHDGKFEETEIRHGGAPKYDMGATAVVDSLSGLVVMLTSLRVPPYSLRQLTTCGLNPKSFRAIVAKGVHAPVAAYREVCPTLIRVNTPGVTTADMMRLRYLHRRRPLFPFEEC